MRRNSPNKSTVQLTTYMPQPPSELKCPNVNVEIIEDLENGEFTNTSFHHRLGLSSAPCISSRLNVCRITLSQVEFVALLMSGWLVTVILLREFFETFTNYPTSIVFFTVQNYSFPNSEGCPKWTHLGTRECVHPVVRLVLGPLGVNQIDETNTEKKDDKCGNDGNDKRSLRCKGEVETLVNHLKPSSRGNEPIQSQYCDYFYNEVYFGKEAAESALSIQFPIGSGHVLWKSKTRPICYTESEMEQLPSRIFDHDNFVFLSFLVFLFLKSLFFFLKRWGSYRIR